MTTATNNTAVTVITATITATGAESQAASEGSVDADITADGEYVGSVTLVTNHEGLLSSWGSRDMWADHALITWAERLAVELAEIDDDDDITEANRADVATDLLDVVVGAVRDAAE